MNQSTHEFLTITITRNEKFKREARVVMKGLQWLPELSTSSRSDGVGEGSSQNMNKDIRGATETKVLSKTTKSSSDHQSAPHETSGSTAGYTAVDEPRY